MQDTNLKKILACCSIAGLLATMSYATGCSKQEEADGEQEGRETSRQIPDIQEDGAEKSTKPDGTEVQIRGKSG